MIESIWKPHCWLALQRLLQRQHGMHLEHPLDCTTSHPDPPRPRHCHPGLPGRSSLSSPARLLQHLLCHGTVLVLENTQHSVLLPTQVLCWLSKKGQESVSTQGQWPGSGLLSPVTLGSAGPVPGNGLEGLGVAESSKEPHTGLQTAFRDTALISRNQRKDCGQVPDPKL